MAEQAYRSRQYEYKANSNLVLEADKESRRNYDGSTGVESLFGKLDGIRMGDKVIKRSSDGADKIDAKRLRINEEIEISSFNKSSTKPKNKVSLQELEVDIYLYTPKTKETKIVYEEILSIIQIYLGDQSHETINGAADEVISISKNDSLNDSLKYNEIIKILGKISSTKYAYLVNLIKKLSDYSTSKQDSNDEPSNTLDNDIGVAVVFDDDDENAHDEIEDEDDDSNEEDNKNEEDDNDKHQLRGSLVEIQPTSANKDYISPQSIDAYWLQRQISMYYPDANISSKISDDVLNILQINDDRQCENRLVDLLEFDKFSFIKFLLNNRFKIYYCTKYRQAQTEEEKKEIEKEMVKDPLGRGFEILQSLIQKASAESWTQDRIGEFASKARIEVQALNKAEADVNTLNIENDISINDSSNNVDEKKVLDLDSLVFQQGGHFMSNSSCELPSNSWRALRHGYEEVHVPDVRREIPGDEVLVNISDLPEWCQPAFGGVKNLNRIQSRMLKSALYESENLLLCAPTSSGKTLVSLLCMLNIIGSYRLPDGEIDVDGFKIVYIAPMKALVQECVLNFSKRLQPFGINVKELSGDQNLTAQQINDTQIIITTPEKWDIITRKSGDRTYTQLVRLIIIDEIHLLHDERGPVLESIVARTIRQIENTKEMVRLVGLSATLPNFEDIAAFLRVDPIKGLYFFDRSFRPVPLQQQYIGITEKKAFKRFHLMNEICYNKVVNQAGRNQVLIFTHSRADTVKTAKVIRDMAIENDTISNFLFDDVSKEILRDAVDSIKNPDLKEIIPYGFAFHHAGLVRSDRALVEELFADKHIQVLVSTATLAWGVNLPCHTVIIKGTQMYSPEHGRWVELSPLDILQMLGRAGRFGLDSEGEVLGNVSSLSEAITWLGYTFLYVRMMRNPELYGINQYDIELDQTLIKRRSDLVHTAAAILDKNNLIKYDRKSGMFQVTAIGKVASYYYVTYRSMNVFNEYLKPSMTEIEIFRLFSMSEEFQGIHVREEEKIELSKLLSRVPIPVKEGADEPSAKVNVLLQAYISRLKLEGFALAADMIFIQQSACRLMRALFEVSLRRGWASLSAKMLTVCKMVDRRMWLSQSPLRQFNALPDVILRKLEKNSDLNWLQYFDLRAQDFGEMVKIPKMGKTLLKFVHMFPKLSIAAQFLPITRSLLKVELIITPNFQFDSQYLDNSMLFWVLIEDGDEPLPPQYFVKVISDRWLHSETTLPVSFRHLLLPKKFPPPTELLDLQPLPVSTLPKEYSDTLFNELEYFNPIQTQTFPILFESSENLLLSAPSGSGKDECAVLAIIKQIQTNAGKCVYVAPNKYIIERQFFHWKLKFQDIEKIVVKFTGDIIDDNKAFDLGHIILTTVDNWDGFSRRWKQRKNIKEISLYIFDELHFVGGPDGYLYEAVISRTRFICSQLDKKVRIIGLSSSLANAKDVGEWIGASAGNIYNFSMSSRPSPLEIHFLSYDSNYAVSRLLSMAKPVFNIISTKSNGNSVIVFVPSKTQSQLTAIDIMSFAIVSGKNNKIFGNEKLTPNDLDLINTIQDLALSETVKSGVGFYNSGLSSTDKSTVLLLYLRNVIQVLVVPFQFCWELNIRCQITIIMDTVYFDGLDQHAVDYKISDILQMLGLTAYQLSNDYAKAYILCHTSKKEYLKKFIQDPLPIESHINHYFHDHLNAEIASTSVENKQEAVDYLTWSFLYRRLAQNPNYYNLNGSTHRHISDYLSELIESVTTDLENSKCITVEDELNLASSNLGMIASYYCVKYSTIELFSSSLTSKTKMKGLLEVLSAAMEFTGILFRSGEDMYLRGIVTQISNLSGKVFTFDDISDKILILIHCHLSRINLTSDLNEDVKDILVMISKLLLAIVDVISSEGWLSPSIVAMELSQMITQGLRSQDSILLQVPHLNYDIINTLKQLEPPVESVFDLIDLDDNIRQKSLNLPIQKMSDVALFCNCYPNIDLNFEVSSNEVTVSDQVSVVVQLVRDTEDAPVVSSRYPHFKNMGWWLLVGDKSSNTLHSIKRVAMQSKFTLEFDAPADPGDYNLTLFFMNDSYLGCDQEYEFNITVVSD
eukprot:gene17991-23628_t